MVLTYTTAIGKGLEQVAKITICCNCLGYMSSSVEILQLSSVLCYSLNRHQLHHPQMSACTQHAAMALASIQRNIRTPLGAARVTQCASTALQFRAAPPTRHQNDAQCNIVCTCSVYSSSAARNGLFNIQTYFP